MDEILKALDSPDGIPRKIWYQLLIVLHDDDPIIRSAMVTDEHYFISPGEAARIRRVLPFLCNEFDKSNTSSRAISSNRFSADSKPPICSKCGCICFNNSHKISDKIVACTICYREFTEWRNLRDKKIRVNND